MEMSSRELSGDVGMMTSHNMFGSKLCCPILDDILQHVGVFEVETVNGGQAFIAKLEGGLSVCSASSVTTRFAMTSPQLVGMCK